MWWKKDSAIIGFHENQYFTLLYLNIIIQRNCSFNLNFEYFMPGEYFEIEAGLSFHLNKIL